MKPITLALLSAAAIAAATAGAWADELTALKTQIDALGARVSGMDAESTSGDSSEAVTIRKGQGTYLTAPERATDRIKADSGVTISVSPAFEAAPTAELSISGETRVLLSTDVH
jgi:hypothetical protein